MGVAASKGAHTLHDDMRNLYRFVLACKFGTAIDVDMAETYYLPIFGVSIISISITDGVNKRLGRKDLSGLLLVPTDRLPGEFQRCGAFSGLCGGGEPLRKALKKFSADADQSGLPFEKGDDGNDFVITAV